MEKSVFAFKFQVNWVLLKNKGAGQADLVQQAGLSFPLKSMSVLPAPRDWLSETASVRLPRWGVDHLHLKFSVLVMCRINWEWTLPFQELVRMLDFFLPSFGKSVRFLLMGAIMIWALPRSPASSPSSPCKPDLLQEPALIAKIRLLCKKPSPAPWGLLCEVCRNEEQKEDPLVQSDSKKERKHDLSSPNYGSEHRDPRPGALVFAPTPFLFLDVKQSPKCDSWSVGILTMMCAACLLLCIRTLLILWLNFTHDLSILS